ncbi:MAG TPA: sensor histidine kinase [Candidatus Kryptobacter bacterium]|nr:sensor histidine kinase [Candidatus Kryptobacter bacterium]
MNYEILKGKCRVTTKLNLKHRQILADRDAVIEALGNLISNSVEYSLRNKNLTVRTFSQGKYSCVSVKDSGIGIPKDDLPRVFEPFFRAKNSTNVRPGGTGLGLSVVKNVMDAHHGQIEIESEPGYGTKITLLFTSMEKK